jgi:hypothetical protein
VVNRKGQGRETEEKVLEVEGGEKRKRAFFLASERDNCPSLVLRNNGV